MNIRAAWIKVYLDKQGFIDPHAEFALRTGMSRQEAKRQAYIEMYSTPFLKDVMESLKDKE